MPQLLSVEDRSFLFGLDVMEGGREQKSLINTFPFNQEQESSHHHHHTEHAKLQHNSLFPFKAAETEEDMEDTTDSISINDFQEVQLEVGSLDQNTVGVEEGLEEQEEEAEAAGGGRKCIDKVVLMIWSSESCHYRDTLRLYINWVH